MNKNKYLKLVDSALNSVAPATLLPEAVKLGKNSLSIARKKYPLNNRRIFVFGFGKASGRMAEALEKIIPAAKITYGYINTVFCEVEDV